MTTLNCSYTDWNILMLNSQYVISEDEYSLGIVRESIKAIQFVTLITEILEAVGEKKSQS